MASKTDRTGAEALVSKLKHEMDRAEAHGFMCSTIWLSREDTDAICEAFKAEAENAWLAAFARQIIEYAFNGQDADGASIQALAVHHGLLRETKYDPKEHGPSFASPGDEWLVCVGAVAEAPVK